MSFASVVPPAHTRFVEGICVPSIPKKTGTKFRGRFCLGFRPVLPQCGLIQTTYHFIEERQNLVGVNAIVFVETFFFSGRFSKSKKVRVEVNHTLP
jgi:hypothetical protein